MDDASPRSPTAGLDERLLAEHRHIRQLTLQLRHATDLPALMERLAELRAFLAAHFRGEEEAGGLFEVVRSTAPQYAHRVGLLEREHRALLADLDAIVARATACLASSAVVLDEARALGRRLGAHEATEDHLLLDTVYTDVGQSGG